MSSAIAVHSPTIKVNGTVLADRWLAWLTGLRVERAFGLVGRATLRFVDPGYSISASNQFALGASVTVDVGSRGALLDGVVTGISLDQTDSGDPDLIVVVDDLAHRLSRGTQVKTFNQTGFADIIRAMAQAAGMRAKLSMDGGEVHPYLLQTGTDLDYLSTLVARSGCVWWVDGQTLTVADPNKPTATVALSLGEDLTEFSVSATGLRPDEVDVSGWSADNKSSLLGTSAATYQPPSNFVTKYAKPQGGLKGKAIATAADHSATTASEASKLAQSLYDDWAASTVVTRGRGLVNPKIQPGVGVLITAAGPASGTYIVTSVEHVYGRNGFTTRFTTGHHRPAGLVDTLGASTTATSAGAGFAAEGLIVGVVTNIHDPNSVGRVKVKYVSLSGDVESDWARVLVIGAGPNRGVVFQPEVNDEVLVGFERGDPRRPVVLGGLFSTRAKPPWVPGGSESDVRTRQLSSRLGHVIEFGDGANAATQHVMLKSKSGHTLRLGEDRFDVDITGGKPMLIKVGGAKIEIDGQGRVTIEGMTITLKAKQAVQVDGLQVNVHATTQTSVEGAVVSVKGSTTTSVEASGPLTLKGAVVAIN